MINVVTTLTEAKASLKLELRKIEQALAVLNGHAETEPRKYRKYKMSAASRARIGRAVRLRWARLRKESAKRTGVKGVKP